MQNYIEIVSVIYILAVLAWQQNRFKYINNLKTGEVLTDQNEINKYTLEYNKELLTKKIPEGKWGEEREERAAELEEIINLQDEESREALTDGEYLESVFEGFFVT